MPNSKTLLRNMRLIDPLNFQPEDVDFEVAIVALSRLPRYSGQTTHTYRVAEHEVKLRDVVPAHLRKAALLHDCSEGFCLLDLAHPVKRSVDGYSAVEEAMLRVIFDRAGEPWAHMEELTTYDRRICQDEMQQVFEEPYDIGLEPLGVTVEFWSEEMCQHMLRQAFVAEGLLND